MTSIQNLLKLMLSLIRPCIWSGPRHSVP